MTLIFVHNVSSSAAGTLINDDAAYEVAKTLGQGDAATFFRTIGEEVFRITGDKEAAEKRWKRRP